MMPILSKSFTIPVKLFGLLPSRLLLMCFSLSVLCACSTVPQADQSGPIPIPANLMATPPMLRCLRLNPCSRPTTGTSVKPIGSSLPTS